MFCLKTALVLTFLQILQGNSKTTVGLSCYLFKNLMWPWYMSKNLVLSCQKNMVILFGTFCSFLMSAVTWDFECSHPSMSSRTCGSCLKTSPAWSLVHVHQRKSKYHHFWGTSCYLSFALPLQCGSRQDRLLYRAGCNAGHGRVWRSGGHLQLCEDPLLSPYQHDPNRGADSHMSP